MKTLRTPRFWLLTTAALIFGSALPAHAQGALSYQTSAPTMVAAAPGLPSVPAEQIARDVTSEFNPRTGVRELIGAPFNSRVTPWTRNSVRDSLVTADPRLQ